MLEQIFGSKARVQIITLFIRNKDKQFYVREISRITGHYINSIRRELDNLTRFGLLKSVESDRKKYYGIDTTFFLFNEVKNLFLKSRVFLENDLTSRIKKAGDIHLLVFTGGFTDAKTKTDLLVVGESVNSGVLELLLQEFGNATGHEIKYTLFEPQEFEYRQSISDSFIHEIFEKKHIILIDKRDNKK